MGDRHGVAAVVMLSRYWQWTAKVNGKTSDEHAEV